MFRFKQFFVEQKQNAMKVGTDSVLLGAWCDVSKAHRVLDIGTGTGLLAMMVAQRQPNAIVDAVEIDAYATDEAKKNVEMSPFAGVIRVFNSSIDGFSYPDDDVI